ncbi:hypothetical protein DICPUDRAFT_79843 [Dictyostelium purpureum]|uniref:Uncharacterized protein n=1 Tax=Dictyostelium purpureum TaxID=5786 RepID=F0ZNS8_DICPU|nr:uncharacterized protein DICPUDRAFT_79843 [Dictyostelium purpureum]EGC34406.1 hypothetical protein DICPUDRAFT_79843 [Dictyostelium purpureum]|eukprot:XP_003289080.1 hypothetical protein DICPUDRAFT_79843 [Dictyostelium purpureum]
MNYYINIIKDIANQDTINSQELKQAIKNLEEAYSIENNQPLVLNNLINGALPHFDIQYYFQIRNDNSIYYFSYEKTFFEPLDQFFSSIPNHPYRLKQEDMSSIKNKKSAVYVIYCPIKEPNYSEHKNSIEKYQQNFQRLVILLLVANPTRSLFKLEGFHGNVINLQITLNKIENNDFNKESLNKFKKIIK